MPRSGKDARRRLQEAALELFDQRGYDVTTAAEIAAKAGVTERTFFRHFPDKREALFDGEEAFRDTLAGSVAAAPRDLAPMDALVWAFRSVDQIFEANRASSARRQKVIAATPALQERMLAKTAGLMDSLSAALRRRGVDADLAILAVQVWMAAFSYAVKAWYADPATGLAPHLERALEHLSSIAHRPCN